YFADATQRRLSRTIYSATPAVVAADGAVLGVACESTRPSAAAPSPVELARAQKNDSEEPRPKLQSTGESEPNPCPSGMRLVEGKHCPTVGHLCREFISAERDRCKDYFPNSPCVGRATPKRYCIDEFEYPNTKGERPLVGVNFLQATALCKSLEKRLCSASEWELACEGPERLPYPNGYQRDATICNFDRATLDSNNDAYAKLETRQAEIARVDQREASGARPGCVSAYGVYDTTGNVDEWVVNEEGNFDKPPYRSALKGGYWGRVRNRCRPTTTDHNAWHSGYQVGFRCCADAAVAPDPAEQRIALLPTLAKSGE
ncbi:MAG TPA: SUMF1/EgtB/PvdO family nonheme iron enzyme, partial [Polyangiaceae bacterium]